jgi:Bacterial TSP3 repeat
MRRTYGTRRLELAFVAALGVVAVLALPAIASAKATDRNHDGIPDRWEKRHHLSLKVNEAQRNQDHEGLNDLEEFENGTNPREADTDGDGMTDAQEVEAGDDPLSPDDGNGASEDEEDEAQVEATAEDGQEEGADDGEGTEEEASSD